LVPESRVQSERRRQAASSFRTEPSPFTIGDCLWFLLSLLEPLAAIVLPIATLIDALLALRVELLQLILLLRRQQGNNVGAQMRLQDRRIGFGRDKIGRCRADRAFVHRNGLYRHASGIHRRPQSFLHRFAVLQTSLRQVTNLLPLGVREIELRER
jgi:hypothetical protein